MADTNICPKFERALSIINKRWTGLIIFQLLTGSQRFCNIESGIGISGRVLSERLKDLEKEGIVKRTVYDETPVRIEYSLTEKGKALEPVLREMRNWSDQWVTTDKHEVM
ncbi:winged helix-turn-helix transcriptional regulator [Tenuibacillus multivorans]|uniref:DNA-binding transcriptional regulator, HxlR family n=1 Tax=Tenuibacillus multivorans TaxID=237069 RepID=A0A1G9YHL0_9BACI|nr:helix-turn-helix domain-containing protein [Tenuibacillus multivorans]GEL78529.1 MarR family transcriptional regulator [Tenuibacillus multivorans]SDN07995.1 DNA-binding transcriptional regulator, HxlR family [Tenuibacillus multivorans]